MKKVLLLTVGTGTRPETDIVKPLVKTVKDSNPTFTVFIVSEDSKHHAERISQQLSIPANQSQIVLLPDPDSLESIYNYINSAIRSLIHRGYTPEDITIDFTSGTKAMTSGAILAGVAWECSGLKYITGKRKNGVVQDGTEKFVTEQPNKILAHRKIELGRGMIEAFRFDAAIELFSSINKALLEAWEIELLEGLTNVTRAYDFWDRFMQNRVDGYLSKVPDDLKELIPFRIPKEIRRRLIAIFKAQERNEITEDMLADLYNNAQRRIEEGKYDDATARLYRLVEMIAQMVLWKEYKIKTDDVPENRIPDSLKERFIKDRDLTDGRIKIGLHKSYQLLNGLGDPFGEKYFKNKRISSLLNQRNNSFLAHGVKPISSKACQSLSLEVKSFIQSYIADFDHFCEELQFPW